LQAVAQMRETKSGANLQQRAAKIPWSHNDLLMEKVKYPYIFDFLTIKEPFHDHEEKKREKNIQDPN